MPATGNLMFDATLLTNFVKLIASIQGRCAMATLRHSLEDNHSLDAAKEEPRVVGDTVEARRARRMAALKKVAGIWSNRPDIPADGLEYQRAMRAEWQR
jgi:hypothetical protein